MNACTLALSLVLAAPSTQAQATATSPGEAITAPAEAPKSGVAATLLVLGNTVTSGVLLGMAPVVGAQSWGNGQQGARDALVIGTVAAGGLGLTVGPSFGHFYAGEVGHGLLVSG